MMFEYTEHRYTYAKDEDWAWKSAWPVVLIMAPIGYRFKFNGGFFISTGALIGAAIPTDPTWQYLNSYLGDSSVHADDDSAKPFGMLEVSLGFTF